MSIALGREVTYPKTEIKNGGWCYPCFGLLKSKPLGQRLQSGSPWDEAGPQMFFSFDLE